MIPNLIYTNKDFYISNQVRFKLTYLLSGLNIIDLYIKGLYHLMNILTPINYSI